MKLRQYFFKTKCMIKISWGAGVVTPSNSPPPYEHLLPLPTPVLRCFWKDPLMTPHHLTSSICHCYSPPHPPPIPPPSENFNHTPIGRPIFISKPSLSHERTVNIGHYRKMLFVQQTDCEKIMYKIWVFRGHRGRRRCMFLETFVQAHIQ